jgi:hypothetical protein
MPFAHEQVNLIAAFHMQSFFKTSQSGVRAKRKPWLVPPSALANDAEQRLWGAIQLLGIPHHPAATPRIANSDIVRAAANIEAWMSYLPKNCVRTMVRDGWHWTT